MHATDFYAVTYDGAVYCIGCMPAGLTVESEEVMPIYASSEWDFYPSCDVCHERHDYVSLTDYGRKYERPFAPEVWGLLKGERDGDLPAYGWPGGYPIIYQDYDGADLCHKCANVADWAYADIIGYYVYYEGPAIECGHCNVLIESAYGDPEESNA